MRYLLVLSLLLTSSLAWADLGPKPTMSFTFKNAGALKAVSGVLYECQKADGSDAKPLAQVGPQHFECGPGGCSALAYGFAPYHILEVKFSDGGTRKSKVFATAGFNSNYNVTVGPKELTLQALEGTPPGAGSLPARPRP